MDDELSVQELVTLSINQAAQIEAMWTLIEELAINAGLKTKDIRHVFAERVEFFAQRQLEVMEEKEGPDLACAVSRLLGVDAHEQAILECPPLFPDAKGQL